MTTPFPPKPWEEGDTFTNDTTGVEYVYQGDQWISTGGPDIVTGYLPLTGGTMIGELDFNDDGYIDGTHVKSLDGRGGLEIRTIPNSPLILTSTGSYQEIFAVYSYDPDGLANRERTFQISANGNIRSWGKIIGEQVNTTKLTSGQSSNLTIHRGSGNNEERKMLIGSDSVNFDVPIKLLPSAEPTADDHAVTKGYVDAATGGGPFLPLSGGNLTGKLNINVNSGEALTINTDKVKFWSSGAVAIDPNYNNFKNNEFVTKEYTDNAITTAINNVDLDDYLPLTGGQMTGPITSNRDQGDYAFRVETAGAHTLTIWNDGVIESTRTGFNDTHLVTKKYVDEKVGGGGKTLPVYSFAVRNWGSLRPGEVSFVDASGGGISNFDSCKGIIFHATDFNGDRAMSYGSNSFTSDLGSALNILSESGSDLYFRIAEVQKATGFVKVSYGKNEDSWWFAWDSTEVTVKPGGFNQVSNGFKFSLQCPDVLF